MTKVGQSMIRAAKEAAALARGGLKPCPFCGSAAVVTTHPAAGNTTVYRVACSNRFSSCPVNLRTHHHVPAENAERAWNQRAK